MVHTANPMCINSKLCNVLYELNLKATVTSWMKKLLQQKCIISCCRFVASYFRICITVHSPRRCLWVYCSVHSVYLLSVWISYTCSRNGKLLNLILKVWKEKFLLIAMNWSQAMFNGMWDVWCELFLWTHHGTSFKTVKPTRQVQVDITPMLEHNWWVVVTFCTHVYSSCKLYNCTQCRPDQ